MIVSGGAGAGKSYSITDKIILKSILESHQNYAVLRRSFPSLRATCMKMIENRCRELGIPYSLNEQKMTATIGNNNTIYYRSANNKDDIEKIKSMTDLSFLWMEEATELTKQDFKIFYDRMRGGNGRQYSQLAMTFNPVSKFSWIYDTFYVKNEYESKKLKYTIYDNPFLMESDPDYIKQLESYKHNDFNHYQIYCLGEWGELDGVIFNWDITAKPAIYDHVIYGLDFGYSVDPTALVKIYCLGNEYWIEELCYSKKMTNEDIVNTMRDNNINENDNIYADCAEPKSIDYIYSQGFNVYPAQKGADSVRNGIDHLKRCKIHIIDGSENIIKEARSYTWKKDKDGNEKQQPIDRFNHAMDAIRYAITSENIGGATAWAF